MTSRIPGFHELSPAERADRVQAEAGLSDAQREALLGGLQLAEAADLVENAVGSFGLPLGVATNLVVDGRDVLVPMAVEETSVVAAASHGAKMARSAGGFATDVDAPVTTAQVQLADIPDPEGACERVREAEADLLEAADEAAGSLPDRGGGARGVDARPVDSPRGTYVLVHVHVDTRDAMGANAVNRVAEALAPELADLAGGRPVLRILSNLAQRRRARAEAVFPADALGGETVVEDMLHGHALAEASPHRAATHNKGVMNGVDAVAVATGNDWRAVEAGAHAWAATRGADGGYGPLTSYERTPGGDLRARIDLPLAVGTVGGAASAHPQARAARAVLGVDSSRELAAVMASVGLAQNVSALRALADEGIQAGHMRLHARNLARQAGVPREHVDAVVERMRARDDVSEQGARRAWEALEEDTGGDG